MSVILCPHCGTSNRVGSNFCNACGVDLRGDDEARPHSSTPQTPARDASADDASSHDEPPYDETASDESAQDEPVGDTRPTPEPENERFHARQPDASRLDERAHERDEPDRGAAESVEPDQTETSGDSPATDESLRAPEADAAAETWRDPTLDAQPWLNYGFEEDEEAAGGSDPTEGPDGERLQEPRLITGIQGLLDPIRISRKLNQTRQPEATGSGAPVDEAVSHMMGAAGSESVAMEQLRRFRNLLYEDPRLAEVRRRTPTLAKGSGLYIPWLFLLIAIVVGFPIVLGLGGGDNLPPEWPGVAEAHVAIENLPPDALVLVYWAYDPATAGELDLAARPVMRHLLDQRAQLVGVSPLPAGPATARRVVEEIRQSRADAGLFSGAAHNPWPVILEYLPGGIGALPLLATAPAPALGLDPRDPDTLALLERPAALAVVFGAQGEDVQHWLEQVRVRNRVPVVAVVSAAADPVLRPYLDSGQLRGLVSGFDGAFHYQARLDPQESRSDGVILRQHAGAQNWAHLAILATLILGNLAATIRAGRE